MAVVRSEEKKHDVIKSMKTWVKKVHLVKQQNTTSKKKKLITQTFDTRTNLSARKRLNYVDIFCQELTLFIANDQNGYRRLGKPLNTKNVIHDPEKTNGKSKISLPS